MGFRFRKSFGKGPFRVTVSKSGVGYSVGTKGFRYTKKAGGGTRTTASIPGTGISYVTETSAKKTGKAEPVSRIQNEAPPAYASAPQEIPRSSAPASGSVTTTRRQKFCPKCQCPMEVDEKRCPRCGKRWSAGSDLSGKQIALIAVGALAVVGIAVPKEESPEAVVTQPTMAIIETWAPTQTEPEIKATQPIGNVEGLIAGQTPAKKEQTYVVNTSSGKFHRPGCSSVDEMEASNRKQITGTREELISKGYSPCGHCDP